MEMMKPFATQVENKDFFFIAIYLCVLCFTFFSFQPVHTLTYTPYELLHITFFSLTHFMPLIIVGNVCVWTNQRVERNALDLRFV